MRGRKEAAPSEQRPAVPRSGRKHEGHRCGSAPCERKRGGRKGGVAKEKSRQTGGLRKGGQKNKQTNKFKPQPNRPNRRGPGDFASSAARSLPALTVARRPEAGPELATQSSTMTGPWGWRLPGTVRAEDPAFELEGPGPEPPPALPSPLPTAPPGCRGCSCSLPLRLPFCCASALGPCLASASGPPSPSLALDKAMGDASAPARCDAASRANEGVTSGSGATADFARTAEESVADAGRGLAEEEETTDDGEDDAATRVSGGRSEG